MFEASLVESCGTLFRMNNCGHLLQGNRWRVLWRGYYGKQLFTQLVEFLDQRKTTNVLVLIISNG